jgi:hypothetical protein
MLWPKNFRFHERLRHPELAQQKVLAEILIQLSKTAYGKKYEILSKDIYADFISKLPIVDYDDLKPWIELEKREKHQMLVGEQIRFYEKTSGSSGPAKYIPYTSSLLRSFNQMFALWLYDLISHGPPLETGKTFFSVSASVGLEETKEQQTKVGLETDLDYVDHWLRKILNPFFIIPSHIKRLKNPQNFKHILCLYLLAEEELEILSIWNASFFIALLHYIQENNQVLLRDLQTGTTEREGLNFQLKKLSPHRHALVNRQRIDWPELWPSMKLISCWTDGNAQSSAGAIQEIFPKVMVQGKGLLATEAPLTFPLIGAEGFVPILDEVFFEFEDHSGLIFRLHELEIGKEYAIIITQKGGLSRYRLGDRIQVTHYYFQTPCFKFIGRTDAVCDMTGEKLHENFVKDVLRKLHLEKSRFQSLVPVQSAREPSYYLLLLDRTEENPEKLAFTLDQYLQESYRYKQSRQLGQLNEPRIFVAPDVADKFYGYFVSKGMKWGDIKHSTLLKDTKDGTCLAGQLQPQN